MEIPLPPRTVKTVPPAELPSQPSPVAAAQVPPEHPQDAAQDAAQDATQNGAPPQEASQDAAQDAAQSGVPPQDVPQNDVPQRAAPSALPPKREFVRPEYLMGEGQIPASVMMAFILEANPRQDPVYIEDLTYYYIEEAAIEGINHDVAFAQMCLETGFLKYGGLVTPDMNNFCGLGAIGPSQRGERFSSPRIGVRAHIQHLKAYASSEPLRQDLVDPRYSYVRYGSAPTLDGLTGTWAVDREYARKIKNILDRLYTFARFYSIN